MKRMGLITLLAVGALAATSAVTQAAEPKDSKSEAAPGARRVGQERYQQMMEDLKLTAEQKEKFRAALEEQAKQRREIQQDATLTPQQKREKGKTLREELDKKMKAILTPEQFEQWQKMRGELRGKGPGQAKGAGQGKERPRGKK